MKKTESTVDQTRRARKLSLRIESLRALTSTDLRLVEGGSSCDTCPGCYNGSCQPTILA